MVSDQAMNYKLVTYVPVTHAENVRQAIGEAGAGKIGNYTFCSFSVRGTGRFQPEEGAHPAIGVVGKLKSVEEERIEVIVLDHHIQNVIAALKKAHPYEEVAYEVYKLEDF